MQLKRRLEALEARQPPPEQRHIVINRWIISPDDPPADANGRRGRLLYSRTVEVGGGGSATVRAIDPMDEGDPQAEGDTE
jgi:hypothetical protein